jgi:hypothetical protein
MYESDEAIRSKVLFISLYEMGEVTLLDTCQNCTPLDVSRHRSKIEDNKYRGNVGKTASNTVQYSHTKFLQTHTLVLVDMFIAKILATTVPS